MDGYAHQYQNYQYAAQAVPRTVAAQPYTGPAVYSASTQAVRPAGVLPGRPDLIMQGMDYNQDGMLDALQQGAVMYGNAVGLEQEEEPLRVSMVVPEGATPGTKLQYAAPDGQELRLTVPDGVPAGSVMTLTQDPITKQWKCMAEPAEAGYDPAPAPSASYGSSVSAYTAPAATYTAPAERVTYVGNMAPVIHTYTAGQAPTTVMPRTVVSQPMPVNLSYVPPPAVMAAAPTTLAGDPARFNPPRELPQYGGEALYMEQRPSYTPPPVILDQRPSYQPPPQVLTGQPIPRIGEATLLASTAKVQPQHYSGPLVIGQTPSYVPPPVQVLQNSPSYVPPAASVQMPAGIPAQGPSITTLPTQGQPLLPGQPPMGMMPGQPGMPPMMANMPPGMPMAGLPPLGQMPPLGGMPMGASPSMGMLGAGSSAALGSGMVPPCAGMMGLPPAIQQQMMQQQQLQQMQQQQQMQLQQQQQQMAGMMQPMPGQMPPYHMPGMMGMPYPGGPMPPMEAATMPGVMQPGPGQPMPPAPGSMPPSY